MPPKKREGVEECEEFSGRFEYPDGAVYQGSYRVQRERADGFMVTERAAAANSFISSHDINNAATAAYLHDNANTLSGSTSLTTTDYSKKHTLTMSNHTHSTRGPSPDAAAAANTTSAALEAADAGGNGGRATDSLSSTAPTALSLVVPVKVRHGHGVYVDVSGAVYDGSWIGDAMSGSGTLRLVSGALYSGGFEGNKFHGTGYYVWPDGSYYDGEWVGNRMHGLGVYVDRQGRRWSGKFYHGVSAGLVADVVY